MEYLTLCLKESMRLYPPVPVIARSITKETVFDGRKMPAGETNQYPHSHAAAFLPVSHYATFNTFVC